MYRRGCLAGRRAFVDQLVREGQAVSSLFWAPPGANLPFAAVVRFPCSVLFAAALAASATAQTSESARFGNPAFSMGQPSQWLPYASALGLMGPDSPFGVGAAFGLDRPILNPITGLLGMSGEIFGESRGARGTGGFRLLANVPAFGLRVGAEWRPMSGAVDALFSFRTALRRGGIAGHGSMVRADWSPTGHDGLGIGIEIPLLQPFAGQTRPRQVAARIPVKAASTANHFPSSWEQLSESAERALSAASRALRVILAYAAVYSTEDLSTLDSAKREPFGASFESAVREYDRALESAFIAAVGDSLHGATALIRARTCVLDEIVLPYDALFGQVRDRRAIDRMLIGSRDRFATWLSDSSGLPASAQASALAVLERWHVDLADAEHRIRDRWKDSRLVWLPPQLALKPDQYDEQSEVDRLVGRAVGHSFEDGNTVAYLRTADLPLEIARSIIAARRYHVLWTHDFTGRHPSGSLDQTSYTMVADAYLPALTAAVQRYDSTGVMPQYFILLDAFYYHGRDGRLWMSVLENPLRAPVRLRGTETPEADHLRQRLADLRAAVSNSARLQRDAKQHGGESWIARMVKVNVNVTLPSDFSFRSSRTVPPFPFTPDNVSRDHRKLVLYDFTESRPYDGELLITGIGIGDHYASATWEDRGYRVRGPAAVEARAALRRMLASAGFRDDEIPDVLHVNGSSRADSIGRLAQGHVASVLQVHNEPGFGPKQSSVARAMLYSLAPAGSVIIVPDPLLLSETWVAMLAGAAARGCQVIIIVPAAANAPSPEPPVLALERGVLAHLLTVRNYLSAHLGAGGGSLRVGIYASHAPVSDIEGRVAEVRAGLARSPWIREVIPFSPSELAALDRATFGSTRTETRAIIAQDETPREPQLHQKTQLIARPGAIAALLRQPGWETVVAQTLRTQAREAVRVDDALRAPAPSPDTAAVRAGDALLRGYERSLNDADRRRLSFYSLVGTQNHDSRGLLLDGEATVVVSGFDASASLVDLFYLMARTTWIDDTADIDRLVPAPRGIAARLARLIRLAM
jgi:hypothetical protein